MGAESVTVCFTGNPNCGKTTLFNGAGKKTANWPGVTVALSEGSLMHRGRLVHLVDTPGIYSLDPYTMEETVTRQCIRDQKADVIIHVADALLLERSLLSDDATFRIKETSHSGSQYDGSGPGTGDGH